VADARPVLVVDDDPAIAEVVAGALEDEGYPVAVAHNGAEALKQVEARPPRLILLDMRMPVMNGWEFADAYRARSAERAPIVVMTAGRDAAQKARDIDADGYIAKPFDLDEILETVTRHALTV
jgi:CheY-like chemotaxis protein